MLISVVSPPVDGATAAHSTQTLRLTTGSGASRGAAIPNPYHDIAACQNGISKANPHRHWSTLHYHGLTDTIAGGSGRATRRGGRARGVRPKRFRGLLADARHPVRKPGSARGSRPRPARKVRR